MALDLHIAGPGLDVTRRLAPGEPAVILGRDNDCAVCLPDPERSVSRRHLSVWNDGDQLHFHVLSIVNGVTTSAGELPPGARGILQPGDALVLSAFRLTVAPVVAPVAAPASAPMPAGEEDDPWAVFEREAAQLAAEAEPQDPTAPEEDPFGDWGFHSTFGPGSPGGALDAEALVPASDLSAFFTGLGLQGRIPPVFTRGEMETIGRLTRIAVQALLQAAQAAAARGEGRTAAPGREPNPLRLDAPVESKLWYLFGGQAAAAGFMPPDRAVAQVVGDLTAHEQAMAEALREAVAGVLAEFDPEALKARLLAGGARLFESSRAWEAYARDYADRTAARDAWVQDLLDRHFARAYARALMRVKRDTGERRRG